MVLPRIFHVFKTRKKLGPTLKSLNVTPNVNLELLITSSLGFANGENDAKMCVTLGGDISQFGAAVRIYSEL